MPAAPMVRSIRGLDEILRIAAIPALAEPERILETADLVQRVRAWQDEVAALARDAGLDVLRFGVHLEQNLPALLEFVVERRLRRV